MHFRTRCLRALAVVPVAALIAGRGAPAVAQSAPPDQSTTPTTVNGLQDIVDKLLGGGTTVPTSPPAPTTPAPGSVGASAGPGDGPATPPAGSDPSTAPVIPTVIPPGAQAIVDSIHRTPGRTTSALLTALRQLVDIGISPDDAAVMGMGHFPIAGEAGYGDDFLMPRSAADGGIRFHAGEDIQAAQGTPVRASDDGTVAYAEDSGCGKSYTLTTATGYYLGCHLVAFADLGNGSRVTQGQIIGFVGSTGDSTGPHLHFEIHPGGGAAVNPKPVLDGWLDEALANVAKLVASYQQVDLPKPISYAGALRRFDEPLAGGEGITTLLAVSSSNPGIQRLAELRASRNGGDSTRTDAATADAWKAADQTSRSLLTLVTPGPLQTVLVHQSN